MLCLEQAWTAQETGKAKLININLPRAQKSVPLQFVRNSTYNYLKNNVFCNRDFCYCNVFFAIEKALADCMLCRPGLELLFYLRSFAIKSLFKHKLSFGIFAIFEP